MTFIPSNLCAILLCSSFRDRKNIHHRTMAATTLTLETALSLSALNLSSSSKFISSSKPIKLQTFTSPSLFSLTSPLSPLTRTYDTKRRRRDLCLVLCSTVQETPLDTKTNETQEGNQKRKLFVLNLPWSFTVADIKELFGQCGTVSGVEVVSSLTFSCFGTFFFWIVFGWYVSCFWCRGVFYRL